MSRVGGSRWWPPKCAICAGRSAQAAKEIKVLIEDSVERVETGSQLVDKSGDALDRIIDGIAEVTELVGGIATASTKQSGGIAEVTEAVVLMDGMTQQNAALVEQAAVASTSLGEQAKGLDDLMQFFTLPGGAQTTSHGGNDGTAPERRSDARPWQDPAPAAAAQSSVAATGTNDEWSEF